MDKILCEKCGYEIEENSLVCMYCGKKTTINNKVNEFNTNSEIDSKSTEISSTKTSSNDTEIAIRSLGAFLIALGIISNIISMFMIGTSSIESFKFIMIFGSISFIAGLVLRFTGASG